MTSATSCSFQPDEQKLTIYQVDFCTAAPTSPTTSTPIIKNGCTTFFKNDNGSEVTVEYQRSTPIGTKSDYSGVPYGTYTHAIILFLQYLNLKLELPLHLLTLETGTVALRQHVFLKHLY